VIKLSKGQVQAVVATSAMYGTMIATVHLESGTRALDGEPTRAALAEAIGQASAFAALAALEALRLVDLPREDEDGVDA
jgi:hypothetical protein